MQHIRGAQLRHHQRWRSTASAAATAAHEPQQASNGCGALVADGVLVQHERHERVVARRSLAARSTVHERRIMRTGGVAPCCGGVGVRRSADDVEHVPAAGRPSTPTRRLRTSADAHIIRCGALLEEPGLRGAAGIVVGAVERFDQPRLECLLCGLHPCPGHRPLRTPPRRRHRAR